MSKHVGVWRNIHLLYVNLCVCLCLQVCFCGRDFVAANANTPPNPPTPPLQLPLGFCCDQTESEVREQTITLRLTDGVPLNALVKSLASEGSNVMLPPLLKF